MIRFFIITCSLIFIIGCKSDTKKGDSGYNPDIETISIVDSLPLKLNANKKWIANVETHKGLTKMNSIISAFKADNSTDYKTLGENLAQQTGYIIKHCSMKGESHDQLHIVLIPMLDEISVLREEDDDQKIKSAFYNLEQLINAYFKFFEV
ncbi:hypothetical protein [Psychroserpens ponticola]|uniref:Uncharacterized protein n=1 Tax=Psychroserpens ponticola TaxID=2932268 RepID=A0ABY7RVG6_9FLAO|nr:hypothetical protein [Psychroserpens ponticola]WCO00680.1 hypothetical protein MUN68_011440 [Psychroserpens ponticola]